MTNSFYEKSSKKAHDFSHGMNVVQLTEIDI